jgi:hemolysin activation/secretion protein
MREVVLIHITFYPNRHWLLLSILLIFNVLVTSAFAENTIGSSPTPLDRRELPAPGESAPILPILPTLPPIPSQDKPSLSTAAKVPVKKFIFKGNQVISTEELTRLVSKYQNREITAEELQEVKNIVSRHYVDKGYINSGAIIPDQPVKDGVVLLEIIEGELVKVDIEGNKRLRTAYIQKRLQLKEKEALNINELQERLQLLHQNPLFKRINAELGPGVKLGEAMLKVQVTEERPYEFGFRINNHRSPSVGAYRGELEAQHRNLLGFTDRLYLRYGLTNGLKDYTVDYSLPVTRYDTMLAFHVERSDSEVVTEPFKQLDVRSDAETYAVTLTHPIYRKHDRQLDLGLRLERRSSKTFLLGRPFSFGEGVRDGESSISVARLTQDWLYRSRSEVIAARSSFNFGVNALDSTINDDGSPDSKFFSWLGQFQWVKRLKLLDSQILFRTDLQWTNEGLLPLEKFSIGGASTVRGYRENQLTRDNGWVSSLEWRIPIISREVREDGILYFTPFIDYGRAWNSESDTPEPRDISSIGLGLRWLPTQKIQAALYWGKALRKLPEPEDKNLQDDGVHFELSMQF